jgi:methionine-rich copper-binding protein CopC
MTHTEGVEPLFSAIEVDGPNGEAISTGKPHVAPDDNRRLIMKLPQLGPGTYTVIWHVTSVDTHKTEGRYTFTVAH